MNTFLQYLAFANVAGFVLFTYDKFLAKARQRRIPESTLLTVAALGGSVGCWVSMMLVRHKTRRWKFKLGLPVIIMVQAALIVFCKITFFPT